MFRLQMSGVVVSVVTEGSKTRLNSIAVIAFLQTLNSSSFLFREKGTLSFSKASKNGGPTSQRFAPEGLLDPWSGPGQQGEGRTEAVHAPPKTLQRSRGTCTECYCKQQPAFNQTRNQTRSCLRGPSWTVMDMVFNWETDYMCVIFITMSKYNWKLLNLLKKPAVVRFHPIKVSLTAVKHKFHCD